VVAEARNRRVHKLARLLYRMLKFGTAYVETGQHACEKLFKGRALRNLRKGHELGLEVTPMASTALVSQEVYNYLRSR
jgi:hypothetical protein